jgi:hypothetical protein
MNDQTVTPPTIPPQPPTLPPQPPEDQPRLPQKDMPADDVVSVIAPPPAPPTLDQWKND